MAVDRNHIIVIKNLSKADLYTTTIYIPCGVDADYRFITIDVGAIGRFSDGILFSRRIFLYLKNF